jgi:hypothetical protein
MRQPVCGGGPIPEELMGGLVLLCVRICHGKEVICGCYVVQEQG